MAIETKTPGVMKYLRLLRKFIIANGLKPEKDYSKHPVYGKEYRDLLFSLQKERDKLQKIYPLTDLKGLKKYIKMKKEKKAKKAAQLKAAEAEVKAAKASKKAAKVEKSEKELKVVKKEKKAAPRVMKYDYPLVNGKEMTSAEKKKYRIEQRKLANGGKPKAKKEAASKEEKAKKSKVSKKEAKVEKKAKDHKKNKKAKKEED
jgi:hypothetical protein